MSQRSEYERQMSVINQSQGSVGLGAAIGSIELGLRQQATTPMRLCQIQSPDANRSGCRVMLPVGDSHELHTDMIKTWTSAEVTAFEEARAKELAGELSSHADAVANCIAGLARPGTSRTQLRTFAIDLARELATIVEMAGDEK